MEINKKRLNGKRWTPWAIDRYLPIRGLVDPKIAAELIRKDWAQRKSN